MGISHIPILNPKVDMTRVEQEHFTIQLTIFFYLIAKRRGTKREGRKEGGREGRRQGGNEGGENYFQFLKAKPNSRLENSFLAIHT